ncbi:tetratricopeptide repeat protein [Nonomuraea angiospora]|uniref:tetratricopeptide repeat protein n=1 Tax=Nonomuraea angiospora TaxID=46172 RepID=UPI0029A146E4|nr:tetratricopeptide repeat protein [Nonomuraea angiospora]MDX3108963.1 tetratricopeptide repeat protein [Nonomuraea angiospora]
MLMQLPGQRDSVITLAILVVLVCLVPSVALPLIGRRIEELQRLAEEHNQRDQHVSSLLSYGHARRLPRLEEVNAEQLGATATRYTRQGRAPYIERSPDDEALRTVLSSPGLPHPFVLVWGTTKAGKSRTLAEALFAALPSHTEVLIPASGQALAELAQAGLPFTADSPALVYLDDLTVADLEALTANVLDVVTNRAVLAATMTAKRRSQALSSGQDITHVARAALARTHNDGDGHELAFRFPSPSELAQAQELYPDETFRGSIAETLVGGAELIARYRAGQDENPAGYAIVQAAIDARRAGLDRPITGTELKHLFELYLPRVRAGMRATEAAYQHGLHQWATTPVASQVALLTPSTPVGMPAGDAAWIVLDHAISADEGILADYSARPIPDELWPELIDLAAPVDAFAISYAAYQRNRITDAIAAARKATASPDSDKSAQAAVNLGVMLLQQGDTDGAQEAYQIAIDSDHPHAMPAAAVNLGNLLKQEGDPEGAQAAYQFAIDSDHPDAAPQAAVNLGNLLKQEGDVEGAWMAFQLAIDSGHVDHAPGAAVNLGNLHKQEGDLERARSAYQLAIESGHFEHAPKAAINQGTLLVQLGDLEGAQAAYQYAFESGHLDASSRGAGMLGVLLLQRGNTLEARSALQFAIDSGHPDYSPIARANLGALFMQEGNIAEARAVSQAAIDSGHANAAPLAAMNMSVLLRRDGDLKKLQEVLQFAAESGHTEVAPRASVDLGVMYMLEGEMEKAQAAFERAHDSGHPHHGLGAALNLGTLYIQKGDIENARRILRMVITSGHMQFAPSAAVNLGNLLRQTGDFDGARRCYQLAIESEHRVASIRAREALDDLTESQGSIVADEDA